MCTNFCVCASRALLWWHTASSEQECEFEWMNFFHIFYFNLFFSWAWWWSITFRMHRKTTESICDETTSASVRFPRQQYVYISFYWITAPEFTQNTRTHAYTTHIKLNGKKCESNFIVIATRILFIHSPIYYNTKLCCVGWEEWNCMDHMFHLHYRWVMRRHQRRRRRTTE